MKAHKAVFLIFLLIELGCGVRGDPVPPGTPAEIGRGRPMYKAFVDDYKPPAHINLPDSKTRSGRPDAADEEDPPERDEDQ